MLARYCGPGLLGLGITALVAGFMAGMAGNVSAFATVWTYDIYRPILLHLEADRPFVITDEAGLERPVYIRRPKAGDAHYVAMGRWCTIVGVFISIGTAYLVMQFNSIMDYVQALFSFFIAPLFGTVLLGMLWKRATPAGGFWGLLAGTLSSIGMWIWVKVSPSALAVVALSAHAKPMAENMFRALWCWIICVAVTIVVSLLTEPKPEAELEGLVYGATVIPSEGQYPLWKRPIFWASAVGVVFVIFNLMVW
jgi:SSS family solute:Na+ symporter